MKFALRLALDVVIIVAVAGAFTINASASTLPGDTLYGVKQTWEEVRLSLTTNDQARQQLQAQFEAEHRAEVQKLIQLQRPAMVEFMGTLEQMGTDTWVVSGLQVNMLSGTIVQGTPSIGQPVWIRASVQSDGQLVALEVHVAYSNSPASGPGGTYGNPTQATVTPWPAYQGTPMPGSMPWSTMMPNYYNDYHSTWTAPTNPPATSSTRQPAPTQQPNYNNHHDPTQCWDCSNNWWDNHGGMGGGWMGGGGMGGHH